jgi:hypothetical protein
MKAATTERRMEKLKGMIDEARIAVSTVWGLDLWPRFTPQPSIQSLKPNSRRDERSTIASKPLKHGKYGFLLAPMLIKEAQRNDASGESP